MMNFQQFPLWKKAIQWKNGLGGLGRLKRIFLIFLLEIRALGFQKSVSIRPIRSSIVSAFSKAEIAVEFYIIIQFIDYQLITTQDLSFIIHHS
jgi:hypothetical protein